MKKIKICIFSLCIIINFKIKRENFFMKFDSWEHIIKKTNSGPEKKQNNEIKIN